MQCKILRFVN